MGEKILAQRLIRLLRDTRGRSSRTALALLDWAADQRDWLWPDIAFEPAETGLVAIEWDRLAELADAIDTQEAVAPCFATADAVADLLGFDPFERELLRVSVAFNRLPHLVAFRSRLFGCGEDPVGLLGLLAGAESGDAAQRVRRSGPVVFGLLALTVGDYGGAGQELNLDWRFSLVFDDGLTESGALIDALAGARQPPRLSPDDFADQRDDFRLIVRVLEGALRKGAPGINLLIYGPPGTGKTELARTLADAAGATLYAVGEEVDGGEPSRSDRLAALKRSQRLLSRRGGSVLLFDEMEDLFCEASLYAGANQRRTASKIFVNRLLESNEVPVIWTSNAIDEVDPAHLRRMSYILRMGYPNPQARARIVRRVAEAEGMAAARSGLDVLLPAEEGTAGLAKAALRAAALADGGAEETEAIGRALLLGVRGGRGLPPQPAKAALDLSLYEADRPIDRLVDRIAAPGAPADVSLLLTGPPGTGKTALAALVAERLDRPLLTKRASDLLSSWVGETEARIAAAFAEARDRGAVLLFDEVDSLLFDRSGAQRSWEVSQVNELLTWMDNHKLPFIAATNHKQRLDAAALRRFVFKLELRPLSPGLLARAWTRFFSDAPPAGLDRLSNLTPGDFAVVKRQLRYSEAGAGEILAMLEAEARAKPESAGKIGF